MAPSMKDNGTQIKLVARVNSSTQMVTCTMDSGTITKQMVKAFIAQPKDPDMKVVGKMMYSMEKALKLGVKVRSTKATTFSVRSKDRVITPGQINQSIAASGMTIK